jgi:signal transduction histidine kinase
MNRIEGVQSIQVASITGARDPAVEALAIVASALKYNNLSDLTEILRDIGQTTNSSAVLLWELAPGVDPNDSSHPGQLFVLADWIENGDRFASHDLPLASITGRAILTDKTIFCPDVARDQDVTDFAYRYGIRSFISIPVHFAGSERGAMNLYRRNDSPCSAYERTLAESIVRFLPDIYEGLREKSSLRMIQTLNAIIHVHECNPQRLQPQTARAALREMAHAIADGFRSLETSIFLVSDANPTKARLEATTFAEYIGQDAVHTAGESGLTEWIMKHRRAVRVFDLSFFHRDQPTILNRYPGLEWSDEIGIVETTRSKLGIDQNDHLQPLSFMGVPIMSGEELLGAIRCCTPLRAPYYYSERDIALLGLVATQVGTYWRNWIQLRAIENENRSWHALVNSLRDLIRGVSSRTEPDPPEAMLNRVLSVTCEAIPEAEIIDIRLHDPQRDDLYFAAIQGEMWTAGPSELNKARRDARFPLNGTSAGAWVFTHNQARVIPDVTKDPQYHATFQDVRGMVIAPISSGEERYGVLDLRTMKDTGIPPNAAAIAELLGQQLGLYLHLSRTLQKVSAAEKHLKENLAQLQCAQLEREKDVRVQTQVYEDLEHQLRGPVNQAYMRISRLLEGQSTKQTSESNMAAIRGLLSKARRVVQGLALFVDLGKEQHLRLRLKTLRKETLIKLLIEVCVDAGFLEGKTRGLSGHVDTASFDVMDSTTVRCDADLLEQAIYNIVDNAFKYSFSFTSVRVSGGVNSEGRFYISVINKGLPLRAEDIPSVSQRGWRGETAVLATGQGSGIGCWFAQEVMRAHGGTLILFPTTEQGLTVVKLQF